MRGVFLIGLILLYQFIFSGPVIALILTFDQAPDSVNEDNEFEVNVSFSCSGCKDSYLRAVFFKDTTTNYFGYTQNEKGDWINSTADKTLYYHLAPDSLVEGSWSGKLKAKADLSAKGAGSYQFKIGRYTSANSSATWSGNQATILINTPTPTPSPTASPTLSPTLAPTTAAPTPTPTKASTPFHTSTSMPIRTPTPSISPPIPATAAPKVGEAPPTNVGGEGVLEGNSVEVDATLSASPSGEVAGLSTSKDNPIDSFTISIIVITISSLIFLLWRRLRLILGSKAVQ